MNGPGADPALERIRTAYERRSSVYSPLEPWICMLRQEKERALVGWLREAGLGPVDSIGLVELGCGNGSNLLDFLRLGFAPERLAGGDLIESRVAAARRLLPPAVALRCGDASTVDFPDASFDVVYQSMMCSSILDDGLLAAVVGRMWRLARPGGGILWYDFTVDNPRNPDVRGLPLRRVRGMFPQAVAPRIRRLTLAPPLARRLTRMHTALYTVCNALPLLRTHVLCWFPKPARGEDEMTKRGRAS